MRIRRASQRGEAVAVALLGWAGRNDISADVVLSQADSQPLEAAHTPTLCLLEMKECRFP